MTEEKAPFILFADDNEDVLALCRHYANRFGWRSDYAQSARQIIAKVNEVCAVHNECYDAIVCDVNFDDVRIEEGPKITGTTAVREIQKHYPDLPVIFITGYVTMLVTDEIKKLGGNYFPKPLDYEALFERINYLVTWSREVKVLSRSDEDRRRASINRSGFSRRKTDKPCEERLIKIPQVLEDVLAESRIEKIRRHYAHIHSTDQ